jgi:hypothetical protein
LEQQQARLDYSGSAPERQRFAAVKTVGQAPKVLLQSRLNRDVRLTATCVAIPAQAGTTKWGLVLSIRLFARVSAPVPPGCRQFFDQDQYWLARWDNSAMHGFQDAKQIISDLVADMFGKLKAGKAR